MIRRSLGTRDWNRAQQRIENVVAENPEETFAHPPKAKAINDHPLADAIQGFLHHCRVRHLRESTLDHYQRTLGYFEEFAGEVTVEKLSLEVFEGYLQRRKIGRAGTDKPGIGPGTQRREIETMRAFCAWCCDRDWMLVNVAKKIRPPKTPHLSTLPFEPAEVWKLLNSADTLSSDDPDETPYVRQRARALLLAMLYTGLRVSDIAQLKRSAIDEATGHLKLRTMKTGAAVKVKLPDHVVKELIVLPARHPSYLFWTGNGDLITFIKNIRRTLLRIGKAAKVDKVHPHRFRDTFAVELLTEGADIRTVQLLLGHESVATTEKHYAHFVAAHQRKLDDAAMKLDFEKKPTEKPVLLKGNGVGLKCDGNLGLPTRTAWIHDPASQPARPAWPARPLRVCSRSRTRTS